VEGIQENKIVKRVLMFIPSALLIGALVWYVYESKSGTKMFVEEFYTRASMRAINCSSKT